MTNSITLMMRRAVTAARVKKYISMHVKGNNVGLINGLINKNWTSNQHHQPK